MSEWLHLFGEDSAGTVREWEARVDAITREFLASSAVNTPSSPAHLAVRFGETRIPAGPWPIGAYLDVLREEVAAHSPRTCSPRYIGHMTSALPAFMRSLASLVTALNQNVVKVETAKSMTAVERQTLAMMHRMVYAGDDAFYAEHAHHPESTLGVVTSGGTLANLTALWCARNAALGPAPGFGGVEREGLAAALRFYGYRDAVVVGSELMHYSLAKAADLLGLGARNLVRVPVDAEHRVDLEALRRTVAECQADGRCVIAIVGVAGTTDAGSIDPLPGLARVARAAGVHLHVDAAWGGALLLSARHRSRLAGIELADSVTIDAHKQLYTPLGLGLLLFRDPSLARVVEKHARYIVRKGSSDLGRRSVEGSRSAAVLYLHAGLHVLGTAGYGYLIDENLRKAAYMAGSIRGRREFQLLADPQMNILLYRCLPGTPDAARTEWVNAFNLRLHRAQRRAGRSFVSRTLLERPAGGDAGIVALRAVLANPLTTEHDIDAVLDDQTGILAEFAACT